VVGGHAATGRPGQEDVMIRVSHVTLPPGLSAFALRGPDDELSVYVSDTLAPDRQRAAVRTALRASRREGWRTVLPVPSVALLMALGMSRLRSAARVLRVHSVAWGTASVVAAATAVAVYFVAGPHGHGPLSSARPPVPATSYRPGPSQPASAPPAAHPRSPRRGGSQPVASAPTAGPQAAPAPLSMVAVRPTPASSPPSSAPATSAPPTPAPSPSPSHRKDHCVILLGIRVCLGVAL
jgi:hypothetical protein